MKTTYIILFLLSLVIGKDFHENDDDIILKGSSKGGLTFAGSITTSVSTIYNYIKSQASISLYHYQEVLIQTIKQMGIMDVLSLKLVVAM